MIGWTEVNSASASSQLPTVEIILDANRTFELQSVSGKASCFQQQDSYYDLIRKF